MVQGDKYAIPCVIKDVNGTPITTSGVDGIKIKIGNNEKQYPGDITYSNGKWLYPITQAETLTMTNAMYQCQVKFSSGEIIGSVPKVIPIDVTIIKGEWVSGA